MKKIFLLLAVVSVVTLSSCEGDGGTQGEPGINILGQVFEATVDFSSGNDFSQLIVIPPNIEVYESDAILVYLLEDVVSDGNGGTLDVWSQLPQTFFVGQGTLIYNFDYTFADVRLFLDGNFDLNTLGSDFTNNQTFRIAVVPSEYSDARIPMDELLDKIN